MKPQVVRHLVDEFGRSTLIQAHKLHTTNGEGSTAISDYLGIPLHRVTACIRAGEYLKQLAGEQRAFEDAIE